MAERRFDVVVFGATGFTGALTAEYLAERGPENLRWALAGRNRGKLEQARERLKLPELELLEADVTDSKSIEQVAEAARVVITTVGPYTHYGEALVAACAQAGTDYVDLTGEPEFVDRMYLQHDDTARRSGARIVHSCGFDSIPYDLGALFTVNQLPADVPIHIDCYVRAGGAVSGGTYHSALAAFGRLRQGVQAGRERRRREARPEGRRVRGVTRPPHHEAAIDAWVVPFPSIDPQTVLRSARALDRYGPDFSYGHYLAIRRLPVLAGLTAGAGAMVTLAQIPPARELLGKLKSPGDGPTPEQRARNWFKVRFHARAGERELTTQVAGGDPGYGETAKMLAESALCLALDDLPDRAGQLTPAVAMGDALIDRLVRAGITFEVLS